MPAPPPVHRVIPPPPVYQPKKPSNWIWVVVGVVAITVVGTLFNGMKPNGPSSEDKPVASESNESAFDQPQTSSPQQAHSAPVNTPAPKDEWVSAVGKIEAGVTVYFRNDPNSEPDAWFTVIQPFVDGPNGPLMLVRYAASGDTEYLDRRATMRSPAAFNGQLVIRRSEAK